MAFSSTSEIYIQNEKNFKLKAPKGVVKSAKIYSAFTKSNLSSIPRNVEILLLDTNAKPPAKKKINLNHQNSDSSSSSMKTLSKSASALLPTNPFASQRKRFEDSDDYLSKYLPGPGQYAIRDSIDYAQKRGCFRYQSLFAKPIHCSLRKEEKMEVPGPGTYDVNLIKSQLYVDFANKEEKRFKDKKKENIGPGSYYKGNNSVDSRWDRKLPSSFFVGKVPVEIAKRKKEENTLKKYIEINNIKEYDVPGPGMYEIKGDFDIKKKLSQNGNGFLASIIMNKILVPEEMRKKIKELRRKDESMSENNINTSNINNEENRLYGVQSQREIRSPFLSKSKKISIYDDVLKKHNPGPCYYQRDFPKIKKKFHNRSSIH